MSRSTTIRVLLLCSLLTVLFSACNRDPNVRKQKYFDSGENYYAAGKYREAVIQYQNAVQIDSRFAQAHYKLSQCYLKLGDTLRAGRELTRTVELAPDNYPARTDLANLWIAQRNPDGSSITNALIEAKSHLDLLREKVPNAPETHEAWGNYYIAQNNLTAAIQEAQQAIAADPSRSESYLQLALIQLRSNQTDQAEANFRKAAQVDPKAINAQLALGGFLQSKNRLPEAEQQFQHAVEIDPKNTGPRIALASVLMQEGKKQETEAFLRQTKKDLSDNVVGYTMLGDYYFSQGQLDNALNEYASLYKDHPKELHVKKNYIQLLISKGRLDEATKLNNEILKPSPHDVEALVYKGQIQMRQNDSAGAVETLQAALKNDSDNAAAHYQLGLAFEQQRSVDRAEQELREAVRLRPNMIEAQRSLASIEVTRGEFDAAMEHAQQIINGQPTSGDGYLLKSFVELQRGKYSDAQNDAEEAQKRGPENPAAYVRLGEIQLAQKHYGDAEKFFQQALAKDPSSTDGLSGVMHVYAAQKDFDKAIAAANTQIAKVPNSSNFYDLLATAIFDGKKDYPAAEAALRKAIDLDKTNVDAIEKLGKVEIQQHNPDQALALYLDAAKANPHDFLFYILSAQIYESKQNWDQAKNMYQQALSESPDNPLASNNLAYLMLQQGGNVDVALNMAQTARRGVPNSPGFADTLGWAYFQKGIYQSAISQFQEALRLNEKNGGPDDSTLHYHLGLAYQKANQNALARQQLEKAVKLSPDNADAKKALLQLRS